MNTIDTVLKSSMYAIVYTHSDNITRTYSYVTHLSTVEEAVDVLKEFYEDFPKGLFNAKIVEMTENT